MVTEAQKCEAPGCTKKADLYAGLAHPTHPSGMYLCNPCLPEVMRDIHKAYQSTLCLMSVEQGRGWKC